MSSCRARQRPPRLDGCVFRFDLMHTGDPGSCLRGPWRSDTEGAKGLTDKLAQERLIGGTRMPEMKSGSYGYSSRIVVQKLGIGLIYCQEQKKECACRIFIPFWLTCL